jgi:hypothetical protein
VSALTGGKSIHSGIKQVKSAAGVVHWKVPGLGCGSCQPGSCLRMWWARQRPPRKL